MNIQIYLYHSFLRMNIQTYLHQKFDRKKYEMQMWGPDENGIDASSQSFPFFGACQNVCYPNQSFTRRPKSSGSGSSFLSSTDQFIRTVHNFISLWYIQLKFILNMWFLFSWFRLFWERESTLSSIPLFEEQLQRAFLSNFSLNWNFNEDSL